MIKTHNMTGFHAFWVYMAIKNVHFSTGKYDIMRHRLPTKARFLGIWNNLRKDRDGMQFLKIMERMSSKKEDYIRLFAAYYMKKPLFHVSDILNDNFHTYKQSEIELNDILATVKSDYLTAILYCTERDVDPQHMFYGKDNGLPGIYKMYDCGKVSVNTMIAFDTVFGIRHRLTDRPLNIVAETRAVYYHLIFDKYRPIVYNYFKDIEWKKEIQAYHHHIMAYGR